jgi:LPS-assembly protein
MKVVAVAWMRRAAGGVGRSLLLGIATSALGPAAYAQLGAVTGSSPPVSRDQPVYYEADGVEYDREGGLVTLSGHVEIWQGDRILRADRVTFDRTTGVAAAIGNVVLLEPTGQVLFASYAELNEGMKDGVLRDVRARLPQNGRLAANGGRRTGGVINELSRGVYTTCNLCADDPDASPLWSIRARSVLQDTENKKIEYRDAVLDMYGVPVAYFPFLAHPDPSERRASGILVPNAGYSSHLGAFASVPYYWVIDGQSDATITPILSSSQKGALDVEYRRVFNSGKVTLNGAMGSDNNQFGGYVFTKGDFSIDDTWRWGFDINRASSSEFIRDYRIRNSWSTVLSSQIWIEGFGEGAYSRLDARAYQSLLGNSLVARLPFVLPRYQYSYFGEPDSLGGRFSMEAGAFNLWREQGTATQRGRLSMNWDRPFTGRFGDVWKATLHVDSAVYAAQAFNESPNFGQTGAVQSAQAMPTGAMEVHLPLARDAGDWGSQTLEPVAQLIVAPNGSKYGFTKGPNGTNVGTSNIPNEDSLDQELTDANLFALNRFSGVDRLEGGVRANVALKAGWNLPGGALVDGLVGQSYRLPKSSPWLLGSGLENQASDVVSRVTFAPNSFIDLTARTRFNPHNRWDVTFGDVIASAGTSAFRLSGGYIYSSVTPFLYYDYPPTGGFYGATGAQPATGQQLYPAPRNEITLGASTQYGKWRASAWGRQDLRTHEMVGLAFGGAYEDECFIFDVRYYKRYTSLAGDNGASALLFQLTFKTVGQFGFHAL